LVCEREVAHAQTKRMCHRICDCRGRWTLRGFARAHGGKFGAVDQLDFDGRYLAEFQDGVILPAEARDAASTKLHFLLERPAGRPADSLAARRRGSLRCRRRKAIASIFAACASSSMKDSIANTLAYAPSERSAEVRTGISRT